MSMNMSMQAKWRRLMATGGYEFAAEMRRRGREEGQKDGRKEGIFQALRNREIVVDVRSRERITSCGDMGTLTTWFDRSLTVSEIGELFQGRESR